jgi:hypothetical protein
MQNTITSDQQMTDIFQAAQQKLSAPTTSSTTKLSSRQKAFISTATVLLGGGAAFAAVKLGVIPNLFEKSENQIDTKETIPPTETTTNPESISSYQPVKHNYISPVQNGSIKPGPDIDIAGGINDNMTFDSAYAAAREEVGPGNIFSWHGEVYNTYTVEEWQGLSLAQRQEFLSDVGYKPNETIEVPSGGEGNSGPNYVETIINGRLALGIDDDHDGIADALVIMDIDSNAMIAIVDNGGDNRLDTALQIDMTTQEIVGQQPLDEPFMAEMERLEAMNVEPVSEVTNMSLVLLPEEEAAETAQEEATDDSGYVNDAEMPEME